MSIVTVITTLFDYRKIFTKDHNQDYKTLLDDTFQVIRIFYDKEDRDLTDDSGRQDIIFWVVTIPPVLLGIDFL